MTKPKAKRVTKRKLKQLEVMAQTYADGQREGLDLLLSAMQQAGLDSAGQRASCMNIVVRLAQYVHNTFVCVPGPEWTYDYNRMIGHLNKSRRTPQELN